MCLCRRPDLSLRNKYYQNNDSGEANKQAKYEGGQLHITDCVPDAPWGAVAMTQG